LLREKALTRSRITFGALYLLVLPLLAAGQVKAVVPFTGLKNLEFINQYYDGGKGSLGSGPGKNFGLQFTPNAQAIISASQGGSGNFINNPGSYPVMFFQTGQNGTITATNGIQTALYFYYSALQSGAVTVYAGPNGTGSILANVALTANNSRCNTYKLCVWSVVGVPLDTTAGSITFSGVADYLAIGTIHLGVPLPTSMVLDSSQNPSNQGQPVTFTATVTATGTAPVGNVTFKEGSQVLGVVQVASGIASITTSSLKAGSRQISAHFAGTGFANASRAVVQVVN
jgi:hypothetical protein